MSQASKPTVQCAIYTRKSTEEGLDQAFNSLDAQFDACKAYIASQKHEGWRLLARRYDDGGHSGATMDRPALKRLLADIDDGLITMVVVYKIDRLTRSLADFSRLVERMDAAGCSFVSVTQSFNTATSMGRLTLNMLLSFAQFEREVTAERIRDKISASKAKGMWMGGCPPLGYDPHPDDKVRSLVINEKEAADVRTIFDLFETHGDLAGTTKAAAALGIRSKRNRLRDGRIRGGSIMSRGQIHYLLTNPVHAGRIRHKDRVHAGLHEAIIDPDRWDRVQLLLQANARKPRKQPGTGLTPHSREANGRTDWAPLRGLLFDMDDQPLKPSYTTRRGKRHVYYISKAVDDPSAGCRLPARTIEPTVTTALCNHLRAHRHGNRIIAHPEARQVEAITTRFDTLIAAIEDNIHLATSLIERIYLDTGLLTIHLDADALAEQLTIKPAQLAPTSLQIAVPFTRRRRGVETRIVSSPSSRAHKDPTLIKTLLCAHRWMDQLRKGHTITQIAKAHHRSESYVRTRIAFAMLSPAIQQAILDGSQPVDLTADKIARGAIPLCWKEQERLFGVNEREWPAHHQGA